LGKIRLPFLQLTLIAGFLLLHGYAQAQGKVDDEARKAETAKKDLVRRETDASAAARNGKETANKAQSLNRSESLNRDQSLNQAESLNKGEPSDLPKDPLRKRLKPDPQAEGDHSTYRRNGSTGEISKYETWRQQTNPRDPKKFESVKRLDTAGRDHFNKLTEKGVDAPHVHDRDAPGGVRKAEPDELPKSSN
jgi:hypothetical protein